VANPALTRTCFLIDFENVQPKALERLVPGTSRIMVFLGEHQTKVMLDVVRALQPFGKDADYIQIQGKGPDAVDFHIAFYIGEIATREPGTIFRIISKDKGFDPLVKHLTQRGIDIDRLPEIPLPATPPAPAVAATKNVKAATPSPATKQKPAAAVTTRTRAKDVVARLKKSTRPAKLTTLRSSLMSWYEAAWGEKSVNAVLQSLQDSKVVIVSGTKVTYDLE
jgi:hypothetical protein